MHAFCTVPDARKAVTEKHLNNRHLASRLQGKNNNPTPSFPTRALLPPFASPAFLGSTLFACILRPPDPRELLPNCFPWSSLFVASVAAILSASFSSIHLHIQPCASLPISPTPTHSRDSYTLLPFLFRTLCLHSLRHSCENPSLDFYAGLLVSAFTLTVAAFTDVFYSSHPLAQSILFDNQDANHVLHRLRCYGLLRCHCLCNSSPSPSSM